jgi:hypothetical protein
VIAVLDPVPGITMNVVIAPWIGPEKIDGHGFFAKLPFGLVDISLPAVVI